MSTRPKDEASSVTDEGPSLAEEERIAQVIQEAALLPPSLKEALLKRLQEGEPLKDPVQASEEPKITQGVSRIISSIKATEVIGQVAKRVDTYRTNRVEQIREEVKKLSEKIDLQGELHRLLSQISIEVKMKINLVPTDETGALGIKPKIVTSAQIHFKDPDRSEDLS